MNNALESYNLMTCPSQNDISQKSINSVHTHLFYHVAYAKQAQHGSLADRGANGGLDGSDVRILSQSSRKCTVTGIDQHQINGLDIVQCAALVKTIHVKIQVCSKERTPRKATKELWLCPEDKALFNQVQQEQG